MKKYNHSPIKKLIDLASTSVKLDSTTRENTGWFNQLTGLGKQSKDKRLGANYQWLPMQEQDAEDLYAADDIGAKVVDLIPDEGTREWIEIKGNDDQSREAAEDVKGETERLQVKQKFNKAWKWARNYGGAGIFLAVDDREEDLSEPLNINNLSEIKTLTVLSRWELHPHDINRDIASDNFGLPESYLLTPRTARSDTPIIHHSRILRFDGVDLPRIVKERNDFWGDSVLNRLYNALRNFNLSHDSIAAMMQDYKLTVLKIRNLADIIGSGDKDKLKDRIQMMDLTKSVLGSIVIDAEDEDFMNLTTNLSGIPQLLQEVDARLVAATGMPHTIILGEGATGQFGNSGQSEDANFKDMVASQQEVNLTKPIDRIIELIQLQKRGPSNGKVNPEITWNFKPLWQLDDKEIAEVRKITAETDKIYIEQGVLDTDEVALSRFGGDEYSLETTIDKEAREEQQETKEISPEETEAMFQPEQEDKMINVKVKRTKPRKDVIEKQYVVLNESRNKILGEHLSLKLAEEQLRAIEANKK
jgi:phage-related protein (TIGR01555 family)